MIPLIQRLADLFRELRLGPRTFPDAVRDALRAIATAGIQDNPAEAVAPPGDWPGEALEALEFGAAEATRLNAEGLRLHIEAETLPFANPAGRVTDRPSRRYGPFIDREGRLLSFAAFESPSMQAVVVRPFVAADEIVLLIPAASKPDPSNPRQWILPAGSVWIRSSLLVPGAEHYAGLRIARGTLTFVGTAAITQEANQIVTSPLSPLTLDVAPEPAQPATTGSDAAAVTLTLPGRLLVRPGAVPEITGAVTLGGFGSDLSFNPAGLAPFIANGLCCFPLTADDNDWAIASNRSAIARFEGTADLESQAWALPISPIGAGTIGAAPHGGSLTAKLNGRVTSTFTGADGQPFDWFVSTLTVNDCRLELDGLQVLPGGRSEIELWPKAQTLFVFNRQDLRRLLFRSERDGGDTVAIRGGAQRNLWDLPRRSDATPFPFDGVIDVFGLITYDEGLVATCMAEAPGSNDVGGLALENLYVLVRPPKRCAITLAVEPDGLRAPAGLALLVCDARYAVPILPDPYATNSTLVDPSDTFQELIRIELQWIWSQPPSVIVTLDGDLRLSVSAPQPPDPDGDLRPLFGDYLNASPEHTLLLDLSSQEHLFGVAMETIDWRQSHDHRQSGITDNRFTMPLHSVRLFMQPQVHWEPVWVQPNPKVPDLREGFVRSWSNGGLTLVAATADPFVATVPASITEGILEAIRDNRRAAALFALPFGMRAIAELTVSDARQPDGPGVETSIHEPDFGDLRSSRQLRLQAIKRNPRVEEPDRSMPGAIRQLSTLDRAPVQPPPPAPQPPASVLSNLTQTFNTAFPRVLPLHHADLSGYGLTTFSEWSSASDDDSVGKVYFHVLNGRTAYEVIQIRTKLYECGARVVRTITMERRNSGSVVLTDSGWVPIDDGEFVRPVAFEKGAVHAFRRIRRITITGQPITVGSVRFEPVVFDADVEMHGLGPSGTVFTAPLLNRVGYVHLPIGNAQLTATELTALFAAVGAMSSPIDARVTLADTLALHATSITSDAAPDNVGNIGFAVAVVGNPQMPRAGQWSVVRMDPSTSAAFPIDHRRGVPIVRHGGRLVFREPADARRSTAATPYALLMATDTSRALFPHPKLNPGAAGAAGTIACDAPSVADPYSLVQAAGAFPGASAALKLAEDAAFAVTDEAWRLQRLDFTFANPAADLLKGGEWALLRKYDISKPIRLDVDSARQEPWRIAVPESTVDLHLPMLPGPLQDILQLKTNYESKSGDLAALAKPTLEFVGALTEIKKIVDTLSRIVDLGFNADVNVTAAGSGASPAFLVQLRLIFRLGKPEERVDIGVGKFFGQFLLRGDLELGTSGVSNPRLFLEFRGDIQQGIIPPLLYAGGLFRFGITIPATGRPVVELALGVVASIGGDLIKGLLEVEVTIHYGYMLIPETLQPGILLGLDARAKLLSGLVGFSFGVEAMGRIQRLSLNEGIRVWAHIRVAATVQIAWLIEEEVDFETEFEQTIPLWLATLASGGSLGLAGIAAGLEEA